MSEAEKRYAQIEKECLAIAWACERFEYLVLGLTFKVETDHKPLLAILKTKHVDELSPRLQRFSREGWPNPKKIPVELQPYYQHRDAIMPQAGSLMCGGRILIPKKLQPEILAKLHAGHMGICKNRARGRDSVWWPGISKQIRQLKSIFSRHGVPIELRSDNGTQFDPIKTAAFRNFAYTYNFRHVTSSPLYTQSNGFIEGMVKVVKFLIKKNRDLDEALLEYRTTPLENGYSPAQLLIGHRLKGTIPTTVEKLLPEVIDRKKSLHSKKTVGRDKSSILTIVTTWWSRTISKRERWVKDRRSWGVVDKKAETPQSYIITTHDGSYRRNSSFLVRTHIVVAPSQSLFKVKSPSPAKPVVTSPHASNTTPVKSPIVTTTTPEAPASKSIKTVQKPIMVKPYSEPGVKTTRSGRVVKPPPKLNL
ncbi:unnamed protein product [Allacma fusca]|uniref:RNA-directed DNA polymerase n=1 Tax=Allacma fusca TaxID=39272 RepID=A0A8J2PA91_9HEXA|nr:unnamed protein product [Allacma fusca]